MYIILGTIDVLYDKYIGTLNITYWYIMLYSSYDGFPIFI